MDKKLGEVGISIASAVTIAVIITGIVVGVGVYAATPKGVVKAPKGKFAEAPEKGSTITLIHGFDAAYPPYTEVTEAGGVEGFDVDVVNWMISWIENKNGITINLKEKPWDWSTIVTALEKKDLDFLMSGMTHNPARAEKVCFSVPYHTYIHQLIVPTGETRTRDELLNSGETISCELGATSDDWAEKLLDAGYNFDKLALDSYPLAFEAIFDGRASAAISDSAFTKPYFSEHPDKAAKLKVLDTIGGVEVYGIATRYNDYWLRNQLNHALFALMRSPKWSELEEKWGV